MTTSERIAIAGAVVASLYVLNRVRASLRAQVGGRVVTQARPEGDAHPLIVSFTLLATPEDKRVWTADDMVGLAEQYGQADLFGGLGPVAISVTEHASGYEVVFSYPDSERELTPQDVVDAIRTVDPSIVGQIANVEIQR